MTWKIAALSATTGLLGACVSVLPEPTVPDALYRIEAQSQIDGLTHNLIVREPESPRLIGGQGMISEGADGGLRVVRGVEWSGPATRQIQLAMIDSFETSARGNALLPELGVLTEYELASELSLLRLNGETATCKMRVSLIATQDRSLVARTTVTAEDRASSRDAADRAAALRDAASNCAAQASQFAVEALPPAS
ncbi:MAG: ABC-type transport auxiliary lipoprotein family protein [Pseudomonadota bacterium]